MEASQQSLPGSHSTETVGRDKGRGEDSAFGVQSLADTLEAAFGSSESNASSRAAGKRRDTSRGSSGSQASQSPYGSPSAERAGLRRFSSSSSKNSSRQSESLLSSPARKNKREISTNVVPSPPLNTDAPSPVVPASAVPSTPKSISVHSLKLSDEESGVDDVASQVITSSGEEEDEENQQGVSSSFPELVMPSIQMPTRRPFTTKGKAMGKLKVLVAGEAGMYRSAIFSDQNPVLTVCRRWKVYSNSLDPATLRRHRAC